jgi:beta-galactosidase
MKLASGIAFNSIFFEPQRRHKDTKVHKVFVLLGAFVSLCLHFNCAFAQSPRTEILLDKNWTTFSSNGKRSAWPASTSATATSRVDKVSIPHNWDSYDGYRRLLHGNWHGYAYYVRDFSIKRSKINKRFFLFFEGVGSYASVSVNDKEVGRHAGGRTSFTLDITNVIKTDGSKNTLLVEVHHPSGIKDLPWVCGGCSDERGFSEGSQPMGIFRPVHLVVTNDMRIEPFGIHAWSIINGNKALLNINTTVKNYSARNRKINIVHQLKDASGKIVAETEGSQLLKPKDSIGFLQKDIPVANLRLWSPADPYLYKIITLLKEENVMIDKIETDFGFRTISWNNPSHQFFINGQPVFINGIAEYEHLLGQSHAFSNQQIISRMKWIRSAGFNAFRDGHQPHNLLYGKLCDENGILWWTQLSAHIWYNTYEFRNNFKQLLKEWVIERRNNPSVVLWGLQNESQLPEDFARECTELIRSLDPTASTQRLVTTCNGGSGTDWDVPQNWTGTYGGDPATYATDLKKQILVGEYGAWRTIDLHTESPFAQNGVLSEDRMTQLMEQKLRLAESAKDSVAGHFFWLLTSHDNPGRVQGGEGLRELDRIGPVNYKGLLTPWEEPLDVFYMFRSNYASREKDPMVYIVSHTWPGRWKEPGKKDGIIVYSNCDEVELFNDVNDLSLGKKKRNGIGEHFRWDGADIKYNILYAVGYVNGKAVANDTIVLHYLPTAPHFNRLYESAKSVLAAQPGYNYIYRVNCGGPAYRDSDRNLWMADRAVASRSASQFNAPAAALKDNWGSSSWTDDFEGMAPFFGSQRRIFQPVKNSTEWGLFNDFRYGTHKLKYLFPLPEGEYLVELYFIEPWLGVGSSMNCSGMRLFDVAINYKTVLYNLDIWKEARANRVLKKTFKVRTDNGRIVISFPRINAGQAVISAIAIASVKKGIRPAASSSLIINDVMNNSQHLTWIDEGDKPWLLKDVYFYSLPSNLYGADWIQFPDNTGNKCVSFTLTEDADVFVGLNKGIKEIPKELAGFEDTKTEIETTEMLENKYTVYRKRFAKNARVEVCGPMVMLQPATQMQPAYDLKVITPYRTNVAVVSDGVGKEQFGGRESAVIKSKSKTSIEWPVQTGVADIYSVTVKYYYPLDTLKAKVQLIGAGNTMMLEEPVSFTFTRPGKWNSITFNTRNMINAGNYTVRLIVEKGEGLVVSGIDVQ